MAAALNTACIKEEEGPESSGSTGQVYVSFDSRADGDSVDQGAVIEDVMVWAYKCDKDGNVVNPDDAPDGWGTASFTDPKPYNTTGVHLELPVSDEATYYKFVAVLNRAQFGQIYLNGTGDARVSVTLDSKTTYNTLKACKFETDDILHVDRDVLPVSHWAVTEITNDTDVCQTVSMQVFRALPKVQFMAAKSQNDLNIRVTDVRLYRIKCPSVGMLLSESNARALSGADYEFPADWMSGFKNTEIRSSTESSANIIIGATTSPSYIDVEEVITETQHNNGSGTYDDVGFTFMYEVDGNFENSDNYTSIPDFNTSYGYYLRIEYVYSLDDMSDFDNPDFHSHRMINRVALPPMARNHNCLVKALINVDLLDGVHVKYSVANWEEFNEDIEFN